MRGVVEFESAEWGGSDRGRFALPGVDLAFSADGRWRVRLVLLRQERAHRGLSRSYIGGTIKFMRAVDSWGWRRSLRLIAPLSTLALGYALLADPACAQPPAPVWTHTLQAASPPVYSSGGWTVYDSRRGRFLHMPGGNLSWTYVISYQYNTSLSELDVDQWNPWSFAAWPGALPGCEMAGAVYDSSLDRILRFGGAVGAFKRLQRGVWSIDLTALGGWGPLTTTGTEPPARFDESVVLDSRRHRILIFGGSDSLGQPFGDVWSLSLDGTASWSELAPIGTAPAPRRGHIAVFDPVRDRMVVLCGETAGGVGLSDAWELRLSGTPEWSQLTTTGVAPVGRVVGVLDPGQDRLIALAVGSPVQTSTFSLGSGVWAPLPTQRTAPEWQVLGPPTFQDPRYFDRPAVAFDPVRNVMSYLWSTAPTEHDPALLRFGALEHRPLQVSAPITSFACGGANVTWPATSSRPPYDLASVAITDGSGAASGFNWYPDSVVSPQFSRSLVPGTQLKLHLYWFDGVAARDTGDFIVQVPPAPLTLAVSWDWVSYVGDDFFVHVHTSGDSAGVTDDSFEQRIPPGSWVATQAWCPTPNWRIDVHDALRDTVYEFRVRWGPAREFASEPFVVHTLSQPRLISATAYSNVVDLEWSVRPGSGFRARLMRSDPNNLDGVLVAEVSATQDGKIAVSDATVAEGTVYSYFFLQDVGGRTLTFGTWSVTTAGKPLKGGPLAASFVAIENPARGAIRCTLRIEDLVPAELAVIDLMGRVRLRRSLEGQGVHDIRFDDPGLRAGLYLLRLSHRGSSRSARVLLIR